MSRTPDCDLNARADKLEPTIPTLRIVNGLLVDPASRAESITADLWIKDGKFCTPPGEGASDKTFDATGMVVVPGGIDIHSHFVGPKVNFARQINCRVKFDNDTNDEPETTIVPNLETTGLHYAGLGYTTAFDAAVPPHASRHARMELQNLPLIDAGYFAMLGNHQSMLGAVADADQDRLKLFLQTTFAQTGAYAAKLVNPGAVEDWKSGYREGVEVIDQELHSFKTTPRQIIRSLAQANDELGMPHPIHVHCNRLGLPGNWQTTLDTMKSVGDLRCHLAHVQFHSYRGADDEASFGSAVDPLVEYVNAHPNISIDVGQIMFGETISLTGDSALGYYLQKISGRPWVSVDTVHEGGCGISPIKYKRRDRIHGLQWAIGLEWMLKIKNPWQLALSTDHPNGASFLAYPQIIALLMSAELRRKQIEKLHDGVREHSDLYEIDREYTLEEIVIITRAAPARLLGLDKAGVNQKGTLQIGADADLAIYNSGDDRQKMFQFPRLVVKGGNVVIDEGELKNRPKTSHLTAPDLIGASSTR